MSWIRSTPLAGATHVVICMHAQVSSHPPLYVVDGERAMQRFGPGAHEGAILILTAQPAAAREKSNP